MVSTVDISLGPARKDRAVTGYRVNGFYSKSGDILASRSNAICDMSFPVENAV